MVGMLLLGIVGRSYGFGVSNNMRSGNAFHTTTSSRISSPTLNRPTTTSSSSSLNAFSIEDVSHLYEVYPLQSAMVTCGVKASVADAIAQVQAFLKVQSNNEDENAKGEEFLLEIRRNFAYIIYGSLFVGALCHLEYNVLFPYLFGTSHEWTTVIKKQFFDNFISGPWIWLPPAYFIKAIMMDYPLAKGWENYVHDVKHEGLLFKYWALWIPAQSITFSVIPDHLRVAFMASVSFFWFILFSALSANGATEEADSPSELPNQIEDDFSSLELSPVTVSATTAALRTANTTATF